MSVPLIWNNKIEKRTLILSVFLGALLTNALCFRYTPIKTDAENFFVRNLNFLDQVQNGYGLMGFLLAVLLSGFIYFTLKHIKESDKKTNPWFVVVSFLFAVLNVFGLMMYHMDDLPFFESTFWGVITLYLVCCWALLFFLASHWMEFAVGYIHAYKNPTDSKTNPVMALFAKHTWLVSFVVILICWLPWIIVYYPASMDWDVYRQLCSALAMGPFGKSAHDPWFASCVLAAFYKLGVHLGSENVGIFLFVIFRDIAIASIYATCVYQLKKANIKTFICICSLLFYAVTPVWGAYAKHAFKDTFSAALFCWFIICLITLIKEAKQKAVQWKTCIYYSVSAVAAVLSRNNPIYIIIPTTILLIILFIVQKINWKKCVAVSLSVFIYFGFNYYIFNYVGVKKGSSAEALSILVQQTARTVKYHQSEITEEEKQAINAVLNYDAMPSKYDPLVSDPIKNQFKGENFENGASGAYIKTWLSMAVKYPDTYLESFIGGSYGYYAFTPKLPLGSGNWNSGMTIFNWIRVEYFNKNFGFDFNYIEKLQPARDVLHSWSNVWETLPVVSLTNTIATYTWFAIFVGLVLLKNKQWPELIVILAIGIMFLTCVASPVNDAFRYYSPIAASAPALLLLFNKKTVE